MAKSGLLLLVIGLVVGLWLGFNPQAHQQTIQQWDSVKSSFLKLKVETTAKVPSLNFNSTTSVQTNSKSKSAPTAQQPSTSFNWKQVTTAFEPIWSSLQKIWASVTAKISATR